MCKLNQIFPPKNLEYIRKRLISNICDRLIEFLLTKNCKIKLCILDYLMNEIKMTKKE